MDFIGNEFYTIRFDPKSGAITSIFDKELKRELVDPAAKQQFNQMIWVRKNSRDGKEGSNVAVTEGAKLTPTAGPVRVEMLAEIADPQTGAAIGQKVILYPGLKRIDIVNNLAHVRAMHAPEREPPLSREYLLRFSRRGAGFYPAGGISRRCRYGLMMTNCVGARTIT